MSSFDPLGPVLVFLAQHVGQNLGWAILVLSFAVRLTLLPLTIRLARRAQRNQARLRALQPELEALRQRLEKHPDRLFAEMQALYRKHDCSPLDAKVLGGALLQLPIFTLLYRAISRGLGSSGGFLWIRNLALPDLALTFVVAALAAVTAFVAPEVSGHARLFIMALQAGVAVLLVAKLASGLALYWAASSTVGLGQTVWLRYAKA
jgi:YidC/Oxa1 family membrane protein insertase